MPPSTDNPIRLALFWHMHQPSYRNLYSGEVEQPWTYLHAIKDYADMAYHLETVEGARAVINFVPILLDEIEHYANEIANHLQHNTPLHDPLLAYLAGSRPLPMEDEGRGQLIRDALRSHPEQMIAPHSSYQALSTLAQQVLDNKLSPQYLSDSYLHDLLVWHHISWLGESVRQTSSVSDRLYHKGSNYTIDERRALLGVIYEILLELIPRYRKLHQQGRIELTLSPYAHPIIPLLLDYNSTHDTLPETPLPDGHYPKGKKRARWHFQHALDRFKHHFGFVPDGLWPSEGAVSNETLKMAEAFGFRWCASGEALWRNTLKQNKISHEMPPGAPLKQQGSNLYLFARHDHISDRIGFVYAPWHSDDALNDLIDQILAIGHSEAWQPDHLLSIIMDGENAWEHYPQNGWHFLRTLYQRLAEHPEIELTTFSEALDHGTAESAIEVEQICAGSWVYGTLSTWIGNREKNRAWELLESATRTLLPHLDALAQNPQLQMQLAICESSDWFWWLGEDPPSGAASDFDQLFRTHLENLYRFADEPIPAELKEAIDPRAGEVNGSGTMKASTL